MDRRLLGNILITSFLALSGSGLFIYFIPFSKPVASLHTLFALIFLLGAVFHIANNKTPLSNYISGKGQKKFKKLQSMIILSIFILISAGILYNIPFFNSIYNWGNTFRNSQLGKSEQTLNYETINLNGLTGQHDISIELKKGSTFQYPLFAIWLEDSIGNYIKTLYISRVIASSTFDYGEKVNNEWKPAVVRRPEALPYWSHKRGIKASDGLYIPLNGAPDLDGVSGATPTGNFIVTSKSDLNALKYYKIFLEVNQSYDWNEHYSEGRFPDDEIYSGSGQVGQPSLIYATDLSAADLQQKTYKLLNLIGHGHHSGKDGKLYTDLKNITTAKKIVDRIILAVE
ncbi:hypothetical protein JMN32_06145 [Fulvivirga sp. 29W222]|uniref:DUF4405 domain-containing protein n=1 Tax=Fulvivirga marina TaxID=2494733 RepID=A0A937KBE9_9BACT|nr:hypothetical protein [Fulvivirga marina]MBL6445879.1 hypothetical protein [Fulvivirga marina]